MNGVPYIEMHSCETLPPASGPDLLLQLGRLIIRSRSPTKSPRPKPQTDVHERLLQAKLLAAKSFVPNVQPSTSKQVLSQPRAESDGPKPVIEAQLTNHVHALWNKQIPICIDVLLAPNCTNCYSKMANVDDELSFDRNPYDSRCVLLERWTMTVFIKRNNETECHITSQWLLNAVRSQLHFSQLSAWLARLMAPQKPEQADPNERRRKLSREQCNIKKLEANCDENELTDNIGSQRNLNIVYSIKIPGVSYKMSTFTRPPNEHLFPITDIGNNVFLKVLLQSLPRRDDVPVIKCQCQQPKRRASKEMPMNLHEELTLHMNDLTLGTERPEFRKGSKYNDLGHINSNIGPSGGVARRLSVYSRASTPERAEEAKDNIEEADKSYVLDDRMHTPCSESGKHKCNCDDESDHGNRRSSTSFNTEPKKLDERRLKEIAKYKRRLRKESKLRKLRESGTSDSAASDGDGLVEPNVKRKEETHTSIPILQAARFDRLRAIGCYRNQTYLTLPASRIESKSPFTPEPAPVPPTEYRRSVSVSTQTDEQLCECGAVLELQCASCNRGMVRSEANYNLASLNQSEMLLKAIRKGHEADGAEKAKKHKCDIHSSNFACDNLSLGNVKLKQVSGIRKHEEEEGEATNLIKRPKLKRFFPIVDRIERIVKDRKVPGNDDVVELNLKHDDSVFANMDERERTVEEEDTVGSCDVKSLKVARNGDESQVPSPTEMDRFRWRFDSAASMVFHTRTGLPLTSSPAPLKRGSNCFDYDDSINGISGIKSALFHPVSLSPAEGWASPRSPASSIPPRAAPAQPRKIIPRVPTIGRPRRGPSAGLLGSFEESALKGRLEPVATVHGFTAEIGASGAFCPPHKRLPVTVFFYAPGGTNAPYMGHINLGSGGYRVSRSGTVQVSLFNPHGTLVKMFVVLYDLTSMPASAKTFLRQRTLYMPVGVTEPPPARSSYKWLRYLIHLRFLTSKSGKLYLHTDIRIIVSRKSDLDTATAHSAILKTIEPTNQNEGASKSTNGVRVNRVYGGCGDFETTNDFANENGTSYELRSFTYGPDNPKFSPR